LHRPKGENRTAHGLQPWEDVLEKIALKGRRMPGIIFKDNVHRKRLDGVSEAHEALPDTNFLRMQERPPILR
jgi:hypothetical protein